MICRPDYISIMEASDTCVMRAFCCLETPLQRQGLLSLPQASTEAAAAAFSQDTSQLLYIRMSAMHWEARRRQSVLDRRMARDKQQLLQGSETSYNATDSNTTQEQTAGGQCPHCKGDLKTPVHHRTKIPNRSSSLQYTQQW